MTFDRPTPEPLARPRLARSPFDGAAVRRFARPFGATPPAAPRRAASPSLVLSIVAIVLVVFTISGGMLWYVGYNYDGMTGGAVTKIHPSTYMLVVAFAWMAIASGNPVGYAARLAQLRPCSVVLLVAALVLFVHIATQPGAGLAGTLDTYFAPPLLVMMMADLDARAIRRIGVLIHGVMTVNAMMALVEFFIHKRFFPYRLDGAVFPFDTRSAALQGHPLVNASITAWYVLALLSGSRDVPAGLKLPMVLLQMAALVAFGGRTGLLTALVLGGVYMLIVVHRVMRSGRVPILGAAVALMLVALVPVAIGVMDARGFFDAILQRFANDGGSANARIEMFAMFDTLSWRDLLLAPDTSLIESLRRINGLEWGIENPIIKTILYHGILLTVMMSIAIMLFAWELARVAGRGVWLPMVAFVILVNTSESIAGKTTILTKFAVLLLCLYVPAKTALRRPQRGAPVMPRQPVRPQTMAPAPQASTPLPERAVLPRPTLAAPELRPAGIHDPAGNAVPVDQRAASRGTPVSRR